MSNVKAICRCKDYSKKDPVIAIRSTSFGFIERWGFFTWLIVIVLTLMTGGAWLIIIIGYHIPDILNPKFYCSNCGSTIKENNFYIN